MAHELLAGSDEGGRPVLYEVVGKSTRILKATDDLPRNLPLDGVLGERGVGPPSLECIMWAVLPHPDGSGGITGTLDVRAAVQEEWGPVWRPQLECQLTRVDDEWELDVDEGLIGGRLEAGAIVWESSGMGSHAEAVADFLSQAMETARLLAVVKHFGR